MSTTTHVKYMYVKYVMYSFLGWLDRSTSMGKGMTPCLYIAHLYLGRIVPILGFYVYERWKYENVMNIMCMQGWSVNVHTPLRGYIWKNFSYSYPYRLTHWYMNLCDLMCYVKGFLTYMYTHTLLWRSSQERGLEWCINAYHKLDDALHMLCSCEWILYMT